MTSAPAPRYEPTAAAARTTGARPTVLVIDDSDTDAFFIQSAFKAAAPGCKVVHAADGDVGCAMVEALAPSIVLLDIDMPGMNGHDVLSRLRADARHEARPIIVLSSSDDPDDIRRCYALRANAYAVKPFTRAGYADLAESIRRFWFEAARMAG